LRRLGVKGLTPSCGHRRGKALSEPAELPAEIVQVIDIIAEILLEQRRREARREPPVEVA
jgi:hypothetical protein